LLVEEEPQDQEEAPEEQEDTVLDSIHTYINGCL